MFERWAKENEWREQHFSIITQRIGLMQVDAAGLCKVPRLDAARWKSWKADDWRLWVETLALAATETLLSPVEWDTLADFVDVCVTLGSKALIAAELPSVEARLIRFLRRFEVLYGRESVTPNMHMVLHLMETVRDVGPLHVFWTFGAERLNGMTARLNTNHHAFEIEKTYARQLWHSAGSVDEIVVGPQAAVEMPASVRHGLVHLFKGCRGMAPEYNLNEEKAAAEARSLLHRHRSRTARAVGAESFVGVASDAKQTRPPAEWLSALREYYRRVYEPAVWRNSNFSNPEVKELAWVDCNGLRLCRQGLDGEGRTSCVVVTFAQEDGKLFPQHAYPAKIIKLFRHKAQVGTEDADDPHETAEHTLAQLRWYRQGRSDAADEKASEEKIRRQLGRVYVPMGRAFSGRRWVLGANGVDGESFVPVVLISDVFVPCESRQSITVARFRHAWYG